MTAATLTAKGLPAGLSFELAAGARGDRAARGPWTRTRRRAPARRRSALDLRSARPFDHLPRFLEPGDVLLVNTSATMAASLQASDDRGVDVEVHLSTRLPSGLWLVEIRAPGVVASRPDFTDHAGATLAVGGDTTIHVLSRFRGSCRLWLAVIDTHGLTVDEVLARHGRPIRYRHVPEDWPLDAYQTVFSTEPGSAEMPSASRPFTDAMVTELVLGGVELAPLVLHTGVSSLEGGERPYPEWFRIPAVTAERVNAARAAGRRVVAVGTTAVRAIESAVGSDDRVRAREGWTDLVITPESGVRVVDGLLTGWHEPEASHLLMLEADRRAAGARVGLPCRDRIRLPLARVRRHPPDPARHPAHLTRDMTMQSIPSISDSRRGVIDALKHRGEAGVDELADDLSMTVAGVRQHLDTLARRRAGREPRRGPGRRRAGPAASRLLAHAPQRAPLPEGLRRAGQRAAAPRRRRGRHVGRAHLRAPARLPDRQRAGPGWRRSARCGPRSPSWRPSSTRTATWPSGSRSATVGSASSSTTAPSWPWPVATRRPAAARSSSCRPCCPRPPSSACRTSWRARTSAPTS